MGDGSAAEAVVARAIARAHGAEPFDLLLLLGDLIYPKGNPDQYQKKFAGPYEPVLAARIPMLAVLGNHDIMTDGAAIQRLFGMPAPYYTAVRGPVEFFVIDDSQGRVDAAQKAWLERALGASTSPWKVAVMHVPLYSSGELHGSSLGLQASLKDTFERYGVQLVMAGHDHNYERTMSMGGVTYIVSGGGCCPREVGLSPFTAAAAKGLHFVVVDVDADVMRISAWGPSGEVLDQAEIARRPAVAVP
jgi:3',5'-cyclic AMP phosphodiesterase CpdA